MNLPHYEQPVKIIIVIILSFVIGLLLAPLIIPDDSHHYKYQIMQDNYYEYTDEIKIDDHNCLLFKGDNITDTKVCGSYILVTR